jgi:hypothetical protein
MKSLSRWPLRVLPYAFCNWSSCLRTMNKVARAKAITTRCRFLARAPVADLGDAEE